MTPEEVGLPASPGLRRVSGLRRNEVARLAGVSVDYYTRLEQGRARNVSDAIVDAIASALLLDDVERGHLRDLVHPATVAAQRKVRAQQQVRAGLRQLLTELGPLPAFVLGRRWEVLAANRMACSLLTDFGAAPPRSRNLIRWLVTDPAARDLFLGWEAVASAAVGALHREVGRNACDPRVAELTQELTAASPEFARWWSDLLLADRGPATWALRHPVAGHMVVLAEALTLPGDEDQTLVICSPSDAPSKEALTFLASWSATGQPT